MKRRLKSKLKSAEFDRAFEAGDVTGYLDFKTLKVRHPVQRINVDVPQQILKKVDQEAARVGVPRTSLIKLWIAEYVDRIGKP